MGGFVEELIQQGKQEGRQQELHNSILDLLLLRFDVSSPSLANRLEKITDLESLRQLNRQAATAETLAAFEKYLETVQ